MSNEQSTNNAETVADKQLNSRLQDCPIAIVGMASVFAESRNLGQFWDNIVESVNGIQDIPEDRWAIDDYYSADKKAADKSYCKRGGFLPEVDFDPMEFGLPPNILELTDITQLMALVVARDVLADAGVSDENSFDRDKVGITLGVGGGQKQGGQLMSRLQGPVLDKVLKASGVIEADRNVIIDKFKKAYIPWEENSFPGMLGNVIAGRIANRFNFGGTNCVVDAACAGSLAAIKLAVSDLLEYRSEMMISGGVCCDNSPFMYMSFSKTPAFTDGDDIRPFDEKSNGMMIGEGVGMIALKRLEDAERDGDKVYAVIKGIGSSSDGRFKSIYAPRPEGQLKALKRAYADAGFDPLTCGLIEAHGTGTKAGDAAEFSGLNMLFSENNENKQHVAIGSVKSQIGHTKAAAGTAGMIKAALALHHKVLPATINVDTPNKNLDIENTPLYINNETRPWMPRADGVKRRAGISSFGFGGTNFHFVLEEYKGQQTGAYRLNDVPQTILLTAVNKTALVASLSSWSEKLAVSADDQVYAFNALVTENPLTTPAAELVRCGFAAKDAVEAQAAIAQILKQLASDNSNAWSKPTGIYYRESGLDTAGKVVALFSGQGSQYLNMGRDLLCNFPSMLDVNAQMDKQFSDAGLAQLSATLYPIPVFSEEKRQAQNAQLRLTEYAQPAIGSFSMGLYKTLQQAGFNADFAAGHSFGELTALWAAGVVSDNDYMTLARSRGQAMAAPDDNEFDAGTMIAVVGALEKVAADIKDIQNVSIANYNSNNQVVVAGVSSQVAVAFEQLQAKGYKVVQLPVSAAFHTELVSHAQQPFSEVIDSVEFNAPSIPVFANGTAQAHQSDGAVIKDSLKNHILQSVHFNDEIDNLYAAGGRIFVEFGPKNVLTRLVDNILADKDDVTTIALNANPKKSADLQLRLAALEMAVLGVQLDNIDPYNAVARPLAAPKRSPLAMKLNGAAYVSPKSKKAFSDCLNDGWQLTAAEPKVIEKEVIKEVVVEKVVEKIVYVNADGAPVNSNAPQGDNSDLVKTIEASVASFVDQQAQLLNVHQEYMQGPQEYAKTFQNVLEAQAGATQLPESLDKTLGMYHDFQTETLRVHQAYLNNQTDNMQQMLASLPAVQNNTAAAAPVATAKAASAPAKAASLNVQEQLNKTHQAIQQSQASKPAASPVIAAVPTIDVNKIESVMLAVVADKTGYPTEMLELSMDMEADLGIDSIKRVEILGAVQDEIKDLPELNPEDLAELRTLGEIVTYMQSKAPVAAASAAAPVMATAAVDINKIESVMLAVVADKTGYPTEMLELSMDMEADLGIDSIKRVEILGAVQEEIKDLPELNPEDLAELRTLGEIVTYMQSKAPVAAASAAPVMATAVIDINKIESVMLAVVADKTGYPTEMLELSMDMEADLGIDSIKRVEILGAVQDEIKDLPELNPEDLAELRTLGEIVTYMQSKAPVSAASAAPVIATAVIDINKIESVMLAVVADKTGYPTEMLELSMDMEADLGIDSIKRVEILGAVQDEIKDLPELNPEDLAELRTLGEIVTYMQSKAPVAAASAAPVMATAVIDINKIESVMLAVVVDKTGYPTEMLELSMDMEADLGIDSIKRVEILGAVQDEIKDLPELNAEDLAELRTLGEIVTYMQSQAPAAEASAAPVAAAAVIDINKIESVMLAVVADKTGYPTEMLELSMDMEADLGIDSIKRVEILGAVQDEINDLPELNAEDLAELRTLGEIVTYMQSKAPVAAASAAAPVMATAAVDINKIESVMLAVVADKTGYPTEMLELGMDMEADLGIDSIKRVEILGAVQDEINDLPELNAEELAELRTLGEIVNYMNSTVSKETVPATAEVVSIASCQTVDLAGIEKVMLNVVADKTGYPTEMLELGMDMEADLGIDSIKRVEILGAVQDEITDLPELDAEKLAELRTLGQIVDYMAAVAGPVAAVTELKKPEAAVVSEEVDFQPAPSATVVIKHLDSVSKIDSQVNAENVLLVDDGEGSSVRLADKLSQLGWSVTVVKPSWVETVSSKTFADNINILELQDVNEQEVTAILATQTVWTSVIYLHPKSEISGIAYPQRSKQGLMLAFLLAKLSGLAGNKNNDVRSSFITLTRQGGAFAVDNNELQSDLVQTGLTGLVKTLALEWPNVFCRAIDVASKFAGDKVANLVVDELNDADISPVEVGFNNNGRLTLAAEQTDSYALTAGNSIDQDSVFLVSGGAKGVTAHCVIRLAKHYQCKFILLGRSVYSAEEPSWADNITAESELKKAAMQYLISQGEKPTPVAIAAFIKPVLANREIKHTLAAVADAGGIAEYVCADVTNADSVHNAVQPVTDIWGEVTGIIHGAGVLADKFIEQKTLDEFAAVYSTKIDGLLSLLACCDADKIKHLVLFSSAAGFYGNRGQSDYAVANDILNKTAYRFKALHPTAQVLSFNWGPWDGGMVTPELKRMFSERGVYIIPLDAGAELLVSELAADTNRCPQILVGNDMGGETAQEESVKKPLVSRLSKTLLAANNPFFADHQIGDDQVFPTVCALAWMVEACHTAYPDYCYQGLQDYKLFKGIVFNGQQAEQYTIDLQLVSETHDVLAVQVKISSDNAQGKTQFHYAATLLLAKQMQPAPVFNGELCALATSRQHSATELYDNGTLFHGESLQGLLALDQIDENGLQFSCKIPAAVTAKQGEFAAERNNVFANDLVYQALLVWVKKQLGLGSLPSGTLAWTVYQEVPLEQCFYLKLTITEQKGSLISADILLINEDKQVMAEISGAQVTSSASLNNLFAGNA